jgi:flagellar hook assembly protein FlgD
MASVYPAFPQAGKWYEFFSGDSITVTGTNSPLLFQPGEYRLYTTRRLNTSGLITEIRDYGSAGKECSVSVYPNPSAGDFNFSIHSDSPEPFSIKIYSLTGTVIRNFDADSLGAGRHIITWDGRTGNGTEVPDGIYMVQVKTPLSTKTVRLMKAN